MVYRKGEITPRQIDLEYRYQVEIALPEGLKHLVEMHRFCANFDYQTRPERMGRQFFSRWCFKESVQADQFKNTFGGERIDIDVRSMLGW